jgi:hypothetical protein
MLALVAGIHQMAEDQLDPRDKPEDDIQSIGKPLLVMPT